LFSLSVPAVACLWDRDTPADEARGLPEVVAVLTGRFIRNPPLYYEMRLARVTALLKAEPAILDAYDDAGVACDRLGRGDEAIAWMDKKGTELERLDRTRPDVKEHWYRYYANLGTFRVHRWARAGADRTRIAEVKQARDEIAKAIEINPDAHFGREKYQLKVMDWIISPPVIGVSGELPNFLDLVGDLGGQNQKEAGDAVKGLSGLIVLGNAWESVDVFNALGAALANYGNRNVLARLGLLRASELIDAGKASFVPGTPKGRALKSMLYTPQWEVETEQLERRYRELRTEADAWHRGRTDYVIKLLSAGRHPDTDPEFWTGYHEAAPPLERELTRRNAIMIAVPALALVSAWYLLHRVRRAHRARLRAVVS
jgi:hypothetical protein